MRPNFRHMSAFCFSFFSFVISLNFSFEFKTFLLFMTVAMLSHYQSPVNCRSRNVEGRFMHKVNCHYYFHFPVLEFV